MVFTGMNPNIPAWLEHVNNWLHADIELWHPSHLHLTLWVLHEGHVSSGLQRDPWTRKKLIIIFLDITINVKGNCALLKYLLVTIEVFNVVQIDFMIYVTRSSEEVERMATLELSGWLKLNYCIQCFDNYWPNWKCLNKRSGWSHWSGNSYGRTFTQNDLQIKKHKIGGSVSLKQFKPHV